MRLALLAGCAMFFGCWRVLRSWNMLNTFRLGIYGDYFHLNQTTSNFADIGARAGTGISPHVKTEGEMAYDFNQAITQSITNGSGETLRRESNLLHDEFGSKLELGHCRARSIMCLNPVSPVFYPGGGWRAESVGRRLDMGAEMYFNAGTHNNFRMTFGPL